MRIPKIIHRIWLGNNRMPAAFEAFGLSWEKMHRDWEVVLWTDENRPKLTNEDLFEGARSHAARADILRYEILMNHGGVYVDTDFECRRPLESLLANIDCFVAQQRDLPADFGAFCYVNNAIMGCVPRHPLFEDLVASLPDHVKSVPADAPAAMATGPHYLTTVIQTHPDVTIFPARLFYPYTAAERWRWRESFPGAYAVHHWTLSDTTVTRNGKRAIGAESEACLTVAICATNEDPRMALRWVLEGLCCQSISNFDVIVATSDGAHRQGGMIEEFRPRLRVSEIVCDSRASKPEIANGLLVAARSPRVLFLEQNSLPDPDTIEAHARYSRRPVLCYSFRRMYPAAKMFPFRDAVDYNGIIQNSVPEGTARYVVPSPERWRDVPGDSFSVPLLAARRVGGFANDKGEEYVRGLAMRLDKAGCPSVPSLYSGRVTKMGASRTECRNTSGNSPLLAFNSDIAELRTQATRGAPGDEGKGGRHRHLLRRATLKGVSEMQITSLLYELLRELKKPAAVADVVGRVTSRVSVEPGKQYKVRALCESYIASNLAAGVLVPFNAGNGFDASSEAGKT